MITQETLKASPQGDLWMTLEGRSAADASFDILMLLVCSFSFWSLI